MSIPKHLKYYQSHLSNTIKCLRLFIYLIVAPGVISARVGSHSFQQRSLVFITQENEVTRIFLVISLVTSVYTTGL